MKKMNTSCKILALLTSAALFISSAAARIVTDETGHTAEVPDSLNRILITNIYPLPSVLTLYLNSADKIIGIHPSSMAAAQNGLLSEIYPDITKANTGFMKGNVLNIESVLKLKPDVVLVNAADKQSLSKLEAAGIPTVAFSTSAQKYDAVKTYKSWVKTLDELFPDHAKADKASKYAENVKALIEERTKSIAPQNRKKSSGFIRIRTIRSLPAVKISLVSIGQKRSAQKMSRNPYPLKPQTRRSIWSKSTAGTRMSF